MANLENIINYGGSAAILGAGTVASLALLPGFIAPIGLGASLYGASRFLTRGRDETTTPGLSDIEKKIDTYSPPTAGAITGMGLGAIFGGLGMLVGGAIGVLGGYVGGNYLRKRKSAKLAAAAAAPGGAPGAPAGGHSGYTSFKNGLKSVGKKIYNAGKWLYQRKVVKTVVNTGLIVGGGLLATAAAPYICGVLGAGAAITTAATGTAYAATAFFGSEYLLDRLKTTHGINNPFLETTLRTIGYGAGSYFLLSGVAGILGGLAAKIAAPLGSAVSQYLPLIGPAATYAAYTRERLRHTHNLEGVVNWIDTLAIAGLTYGSINLVGGALASVAPAVDTVAGLVAPVAASGVTSWRLRNVHQWSGGKMIFANLALAGLAGYGVGEALGAYTGSGDILAGAKDVLDTANHYSQLGLNKVINGLGTNAVTEGLMGMGVYGIGKGVGRLFHRN